MTVVIPDLAEATLSDFVARLRQDADLKLSVVKGIKATGFLSVLDQFFKISAEQRRRLEGVSGGPAGSSPWDEILVLAVLSDGDITMRQTGAAEVTLQATTTGQGLSVGVSVGVEC
ncbi:hypothetical protein AB0F96_26900 [Streptomyces sp. NPDC023998]|uniref:hypothetical protein n=1 Tax=Streptomyces sp. NPDC023998 TaxID=3154597 RepID=UPI0033C67E99